MFDKALALSQATIALSLAILKDGITTPKAILNAILGGLQIAKIASTPIPQYFEGTPNSGHGGGLAMVGEIGSELIKEPNKAPYLSSPFAEIKDLPKGTHVIPHDETMKQLAFSGLMRGVKDSRIDDSRQIEAINKGFQSLERTIKNKREHIITGAITGYKSRGTKVNVIK